MPSAAGRPRGYNLLRNQPARAARPVAEEDHGGFGHRGLSGLAAKAPDGYDGSMYPHWLEHLTLLESALFIGIVLPGVVASALLWRERFRVSLSRPDQRRIALLLGVAGLSFLALVTALAIRFG